jgi:hypothetical protein
MNQETHVLGLKSLEKLLLQQGFVICHKTGQRITQMEDLAAVHLGVGEDQFIFFPVHIDNAKELLKTMIKTFSGGLPALEEKESEDFCWRD